MDFDSSVEREGILHEAHVMQISLSACKSALLRPADTYNFVRDATAAAVDRLARDLQIDDAFSCYT